LYICKLKSKSSDPKMNDVILTEMPDRDLTKAEEQIMQVLWDLDKALVHDILKAFPEPKPAYNTVSTIIRILEQYFPLVSKPDYTKRFFRHMILNYFGNSCPSLASFFTREENLSLKELEEIRGLIDKEIKTKKAKT